MSETILFASCKDGSLRNRQSIHRRTMNIFTTHATSLRGSLAISGFEIDIVTKPVESLTRSSWPCPESSASRVFSGELLMAVTCNEFAINRSLSVNASLQLMSHTIALMARHKPWLMQQAAADMQLPNLSPALAAASTAAGLRRGTTNVLKYVIAGISADVTP